MPRKSIYDSDRLGRIAREQFGVIGRDQALDCGVSRSAVAYLLRQHGPWRKIVPGVYATTTGDMSPDARAMAALLHAGPRGVITGAVAVRRHNLRCAGLNEVDVLVPSGTRVQSAGFVRIIHTSRMPETFYTTRQIRYALPARAVAATRPRAKAALKTLIHRSNLERPMYNATLYSADGTFLGIADAWWARAAVVGEVDSRQYHLSPEDYARTTARHNHMTAYGINLLHFLPSMLRQEPSTVIDDLRGAITRGNSRPPL